MRIGVVSDTHGLLRPEAEAALAGAEHIVHAGDVGAPDILPRLREIAPVTAIRGNVDVEDWAEGLPDVETVRLAGRTIRIVHDAASIGPDDLHGVDVLVHGHSHRPAVEADGGLLRLNPGSAGRRRFSLPVTRAILHLGGEIRAEILHLLPPR